METINELGAKPFAVAGLNAWDHSAASKGVPMSIKATIETITPSVAEHLLANKATNRVVKKGPLERYTASMQAGTFNGLNGETIILNDLGQLIDGQHRMLALIASGVSSLKFLVVRGGDSKTVDHGVSRTLGDELAMAGHKHSHALAAAARWLWIYENQWPDGIGSRASNVPQEVVQQVLSTHPDIVQATEDAMRVYPKAALLLTGSVACFTRLITSRLDPMDSEEFFYNLEFGEGTPRSKVVRLLRDRLLVRNTRSGRLTGPDIVAITVRAWNAYRENRQLTKLFVGKDLNDPYASVPRFI